MTVKEIHFLNAVPKSVSSIEADPDYQQMVQRTVDRHVNQDLAARATGMLTAMTPNYAVDGNYTVCVLVPRTEIGVNMIIGVAKRNPTDKYVAIRGKSMALSRAIHNYLESITNK